jgi:hypothetical protein
VLPIRIAGITSSGRKRPRPFRQRPSKGVTFAGLKRFADRE